jgi:hypothetical protein
MAAKTARDVEQSIKNPRTDDAIAIIVNGNLYPYWLTSRRAYDKPVKRLQV